MPQGIEYDVRANLKTAGSFQREAMNMARAADSVGKSYTSMSSRLVSAGERVRGTFGQTTKDFLRMSAVAAGGALVTGIAAAAREGIRFNNEMEQGALGLGTMYTTFGVAANSAAVMSGEMTEFTKSVELATAMQQELFDIAKLSPATFEDVALAYRSMAPALTGVTGDLQRQRDLMANMSLLGFATGGDYKQLGMDIGRIVKGMAEMDNLTFQQMRPAFEDAFEAVTGKKAVNDFNTQWNKAAKLDPDQALKIVETVGQKMGGEISEAFGASFGGMAATLKSQGQVLAGTFGAPLMDSMKKAMATVAGDEGMFGRLEDLAAGAGQVLARAADQLFAKLIAGADYVSRNWETIANKIQEAGVLAGIALKAAAVVATTRMVAGNAMILAGKTGSTAKMIAGGARRGRDAWGAAATRRHMGISRGMAGKGEGGLGMMGRGLGKIFGKLNTKALFGVGRGLDRLVLGFATMAPMIAAAGVALSGVALAFSGVIVVVGGLAAYVASSWDQIKTSIVTAIQTGQVTLVPLITSLYTFYERLRLVGDAIFGNISAAGVMAGGLDLLTGAVDFASMVIGSMISVVAYGIEAFGAFRLAFSALLQLIGDGLRVMAKIPKVGEGLDGAIGSIEKMSQNSHNAAQDTFQTARRFHDAAAAVKEAQLTPMQFEAARKKAKDLEQSLSDMLTGGKDGKGRGRGGTKIGKVEVVINTTDPDPDRLFAAFIKKTTGLADRRVQAYDALEQGT